MSSSVLLSLLMLTTVCPGIVYTTSKLPHFIRKCEVSQSDEDCIKENVDRVRPLMARGFPELGIPALEPLHVNELSTIRDSGAVVFKVTFRNVTVNGISKFVLNGVKVDRGDGLKGGFTFNVTTPFVRCVGQYEVSGRVLLLPISGKGTGWINIYNLATSTEVFGKRVVRDGRLYGDVDNIKIRYNIGNVQMRMNNLFNGNKLLGETMNKFINENWRELLPEINDNILEIANRVIKTGITRIAERVPLGDFVQGEEISTNSRFRDLYNQKNE